MVFLFMVNRFRQIPIGKSSGLYIFNTYLRNLATKSDNMVRILNVAEKNDAAKSLADIMSGGRYRRVCHFVVAMANLTLLDCTNPILDRKRNLGLSDDGWVG